MLKHWINREFKDGQIPYTVQGCTMIGTTLDKMQVKDGEVVVGDCVIMVNHIAENGDMYTRVAIAVCTDGTWIKGIGVLDIVLH